MDKSLRQLMAGIEARAKLEEEEKYKPNENSASLEENTVTKSNALARAYYRFGLVEKRVMEALISKLNPQLSTHKLQPIQLNASDYAKAFNVSPKHAYEQLTDAIDALLHRVIVVRETDRLRKLNLTTEAVYEETKGTITVTFSPLVTPHLIGLKKKFTKYPLQATVNFRSSYSWRIYELLVSWAKDPKLTGGILAGWFTVKVDELREMLGVPNSYQWNDLRRKVLHVATEELKSKAQISLGIERIKSARKITHLKFTFAQMTEKKRVGSAAQTTKDV